MFEFRYGLHAIGIYIRKEVKILLQTHKEVRPNKEH